MMVVTGREFFTQLNGALVQYIMNTNSVRVDFFGWGRFFYFLHKIAPIEIEQLFNLICASFFTLNLSVN